MPVIDATAVKCAFCGADLVVISPSPGGPPPDSTPSARTSQPALTMRGAIVPSVVAAFKEADPGIVTGLVAAFLIVVAVLIAAPIFVLTGFGLLAVTSTFHTEGTASAVVSIIWFSGTLVLVAIVLRRLIVRPFIRRWPTTPRTGPLGRGVEASDSQEPDDLWRSIPHMPAPRWVMILITAFVVVVVLIAAFLSLGLSP